MPILIDGDIKLYESMIVLEYLSARYADRGTPLLPADPGTAARARLFIETFSQHFSPSLFGVLRADTKEGVAAATETLKTALTTIDK